MLTYRQRKTSWILGTWFVSWSITSVLSFILGDGIHPKHPSSWSLRLTKETSSRFHSYSLYPPQADVSCYGGGVMRVVFIVITWNNYSWKFICSLFLFSLGKSKRYPYSANLERYIIHYKTARILIFCLVCTVLFTQGCLEIIQTLLL